MPIVTISEASREWKTSRSRLYHLKDSGKLSFTEFADGRPGIDTGELLRVLGEPKSGAGQAAPEQPETASLQEQVRVLSEQLATAQRERDAALADKERLFGVLESQARLLQAPDTGKDKPEHGPILRFLLKKVW